MATHTPWQGHEFKGAAVRVMILGESHHGYEQRDMTHETINRWREGETSRNYAFFTKIAVMLTDQRPWELDRKAAFAPIGFHNYTQRVIDGPREPPTWQDLVDAEPSFYAALDKLRPTHLIVLGKKTLWSPPIRNSMSDAPKVKLHDKDFPIGRIVRDSRTTLVMPMQHPSSRYNGHTWHPRFRSFVMLQPESAQN